MSEHHIATEIYSGILQHTRWKAGLKKTIDTGDIWENYQPDPEQCAFGRWMKENYLDLTQLVFKEHFDEVDKLHRLFHQVGEQVVENVLKGDVEAAKQAMEYGGEFEQISQQLVQAIINWHEALTKQEKPADSSAHII